MQRAPPTTDITTLPLKPTNKPTESRPIPNAKSFFTRSKAGIQGRQERVLGVPPRADVTGPSSPWKPEAGSPPLPSFPRKRESRAGKDGSLASASSRHRPFVPTEAGSGTRIWIPAFAGMTERGAYPPRADGPPGAVGAPSPSFPQRTGPCRPASSRRHRPFVPMEAGSGIRIWKGWRIRLEPMAFPGRRRKPPRHPRESGESISGEALSPPCDCAKAPAASISGAGR